jgi:hypothetical protein
LDVGSAVELVVVEFVSGLELGLGDTLVRVDSVLLWCEDSEVVWCGDGDVVWPGDSDAEWCGDEAVY